MRPWLLSAFVAAPLGAAAAPGAFVAPEGVDAISTRSHVVAALDDGTVTMTVSANLVSSSYDVAFLVPVPVAFDVGGVETVAADVLHRLDEYTAPRVLSFDCDDLYPFGGQDTSRRYYGYYGYDYYYGFYDYSRGFKDEPGPWSCDRRGRRDRYDRDYGYFYEGDYDYGDAFDTGPRDIPEEVDVIASATESVWHGGAWTVEAVDDAGHDDLVAWLSDRGLVVGDTEASVLQDYVDDGWTFFFARITLTTAPDSDDVLLPPLQYRYSGDAVTLPLRVGAADTVGAQDTIVTVLNASGAGSARIDTYTAAEIDAECLAYMASDDTFTDYYTRLFESAITAQGGTGWVLEFQQSGGDCEPCGGTGGLAAEDAEILGWTGSVDGVYVTRMRLRTPPEDALQRVDVAIAYNGEPSQLNYIEYRDELTGSFRVCGEDNLRHYGTCFDRSAKRARSGRARQVGAASFGSAMILGLLLWRRRVSAGR